MAKMVLEVSDELQSVIDKLALVQNVSKPEVVARALTLMNIAEDKGREGYALGLTKDGETQEIQIR